MDIFSLPLIDHDKSVDDIVPLYKRFRAGLDHSHVLKDIAHPEMIRSIRKVQPIGASVPRFLYTIEFPITNNNWTCKLFEFLNSVQDKYWITSTYTCEFVKDNTFHFNILDVEKRHPFVFWNKEY